MIIRSLSLFLVSNAIPMNIVNHLGNHNNIILMSPQLSGAVTQLWYRVYTRPPFHSKITLSYKNRAQKFGLGHKTTFSLCIVLFPNFIIPTQGVYNRLLLVPIVGSACYLRHQLAAVFNASFGVFQMTYKISRINRMGEEGDFCDTMPTYP